MSGFGGEAVVSKTLAEVRVWPGAAVGGAAVSQSTHFQRRERKHQPSEQASLRTVWDDCENCL